MLGITMQLLAIQAKHHIGNGQRQLRGAALTYMQSLECSRQYPNVQTARAYLNAAESLLHSDSTADVTLCERLLPARYWNELSYVWARKGVGWQYSESKVASNTVNPTPMHHRRH